MSLPLCLSEGAWSLPGCVFEEYCILNINIFVFTFYSLWVGSGDGEYLRKDYNFGKFVSYSGES